jgi:hypothetical protein
MKSTLRKRIHKAATAVKDPKIFNGLGWDPKEFKSEADIILAITKEEESKDEYERVKIDSKTYVLRKKKKP